MLFDDMEFGPYDKAERRARKAYELYEDGKMAQALVELELALEINPANSAWHFNKGLTLDAISRFREAIAEYEAALELNPDDLEILNSLAVDYTRTGQYDRAINTFEYVQQLDSRFEPSYCNRIITYTEMGLHDMAEQMFYLAQQIDPDCALCFYNIGNSLFARGQYKKAIRCWLKTAELEATHPQINYRIAQAYWSDGDPEQAHEHFLTELRQSPGDVDVIMDFALFLLEQGNIESAKEKLNRILEFDPDYAPALFYLGEVAFDQECWSRAETLFKEALERDPDLPGPHYRLAQCALASERPQDARSHLMAELELEIEEAETLVSMGSMFLTLGDTDHATHCLLRATSLDVVNPEAYYYLAVTSANKGSFEDAIQFFNHAVNLKTDYVSALRDSAYTFLATGQPKRAAERIRQARTHAPKNWELRMLDYSTRVSCALHRFGTMISTLVPRRAPRRQRS